MTPPSAEEVDRKNLEVALLFEETGLDVDIAREELAALQQELMRRRWRDDPVAWAQERLGDTLWSKQREILGSIATRRRTAVQSCHEIGKSYIAAVACAWWLDIWPVGESFVITSAPTGPQVQAILWREIGRTHSRGQLRGRVNQTEWYMKPVQGNEEVVAFGRKPSDYEPTAFQGIHARRVLYVFDEACGMPKLLWEAADSMIANDLSKALAIGNPDDPLCEFAEICKPGSGWNVIAIGAFQSPNFTGEPMPQIILDQLIGATYVEEKRRKWAPTWRWSPNGKIVEPPLGAKPEETCNPLWMSKVLGLFPPNTTQGGLIPVPWIWAAQERTLPAVGTKELGLDVGGGGDSSTLAERTGQVVRIINEDHNPDTMQTCGLAVHEARTRSASCVKVDTIGIGRGVVDRGRELFDQLESPAQFYGVNVGEAADDSETFLNRRAELWWNVRTLFEQGQIDIDPTDEDLAAELLSIRFKRTSAGKVQIESKEEARRRGVASPNRAEALMLALAPPREESEGIATWR